MNNKDFNNTYYKDKPENFSQHLNQATGAYNKTSKSGNVITENKDFVQINIHYQSELAELALTESVASAIFMLMATRMGNNNIFITSKQKLAKATHKSLSTIKRAMRILKERNFIVSYLKINGNQGTAYFVNPQICCKCSASHKQYLISQYLTLTECEEYHADEEIIDVKALIDKERLVLVSDEKRQLDVLKRQDNVDIHAMLQIAQTLSNSGYSQEEILQKLNLVGDTTSITPDKQAKEEQALENLEKNIALKERKLKLIKKNSKLTEDIEFEKNKAELAEKTKKAHDVIESVAMSDEYWKDAFMENERNDENG